MQNRITNVNSNHRLPPLTWSWQVNPANYLVSERRAMLEFLIAPGTSQTRDDHQRLQTVREKCIAEFKTSERYTRYDNLLKRLRAAEGELRIAREGQEAAELQYT